MSRSSRFSRALLLCALPTATLLAIACGSSSGSGFGDGSGADGGLGADTGNGFQFGTDGSSGGGGDDDASAAKANTASVEFVPATATLTTDGATAKSQSYDLQATLKDGSKVIVLPDSVQFDRPDLATAKVSTSTVLTASGPYAGTGTLHGVYGPFEATATLTINVAKKDLNGISTTIATALDGATATDPSVSTLLYPYDKTVFALGLTSPKIMWDSPNTGDTYRFHLSQGNYTYDTYAAVGKPGQFRIDQTVWDIVTASNKGSNTPLTLSVSRYDAAKQVAYVSATETFTIAPESLRGAIYYWTASQDATGLRKGHISRFRPGTGSAPVPLNNGKCMGCHAVNAQGTVLVGDIDDNNVITGKVTDPSSAPYGNWSKTRAWASFDVSKPDAPLSLQTTKFGADIALNPDGKYVVFGGPTTVDTGGSVASNPIAGSKFLSLATVADGNVIAASGLDAVNVPSGKGMQMPAFSPDGTMLAVVVSSFSADNVIPDSSGTSIKYLSFNEDNAFFGQELQPLVDGADPVFTATTGKGLAYPSFTPDSKAVAFHVGKTATGCSGTCDDTEIDDGNLFVQPVGATGSPIAMTNASDPPNPAEARLSVEPTFNPQQRGGYSWVVFTSFRSWGNQPFPDGTPAGFSNGKRRLWVAAVDPTVGTVDPSHPAIYLEGQEDTPNMRGFWANAVCTATAAAGAPPNACTAGYECCSGFCVGGACVDPSTVACAGLGGSCKTVADCCNPSAVACTNNACTSTSVIK